MAPVWQLEVIWPVVCVACSHGALVLAIMLMYNIFNFYSLQKSGIDRSTEGSTIPVYRAFKKKN